MTSTELMPAAMIIPLLYLEANKLNMASYVISGHCERELFFILFVVMAESEGPRIRRGRALDVSWIQEIGKSQMSHNHIFNVSEV